MVRFFTPARLLRLYPGIWRLRYGNEFLGLLESAPITRALVFDIVRAAANEWIARTRVGRLLLAVVVSAAGTACAAVLFLIVPLTSLSRTLMHAVSLWSLVMLALNDGAPIVVGFVLMLATFCRNHWYGRLGLRTQLILLLVAIVWRQWLAFGYRPETVFAWDTIARAVLGNSIGLAWMLVLLFNMERVADPPVPLRMRMHSHRP